MSSSCRNARYSRALARACATAVAVSLPVGVALAAETYVQPQVDLRVEWNDNWDLVPDSGSDSEVYGYIADLLALIGMATPRSDTSVRPRIKLQEFPDREDLDRFEGFLDLRSQYRWETSELLTNVRYSHQNLYDVVLAEAEFDPLDPNYGQVPDTARRRVGDTRDRFDITPEFSYRFSQRIRAGVGASFQTSRYESDLQQDYDYLQGQGFVAWTLDPRNEVRVGAYTSRFDVKDGSSETSAYGVSAGWTSRWSEISGLEMRLFYEDNDVTEYLPVKRSESSSGVGGNATFYLNGVVSQWRFSAESGFYPTGDGGKKETDQLRLQYRHDLSKRLQFNGAFRAIRERAIGTADDTDDRDYARLELSTRWMLAPTWYVVGGYNYTWQEYQIENDDAANNQVFVSFGYIGLGRPRR